MKTVCIIGGGVSGSLTAVQLLKKSEKVKVILINSGNPLLTGVAYSTQRAEHLLNVPAGKMSVYPDKPDHFIEWLKSLPEFEKSSDADLKHSFLPRMIYGSYLGDVLNKFMKDDRITVVESKAEAAGRSENKYVIRLEAGSSIEADVLVLAMGNFLPAAPKLKDCSAFSNQHFYANPWSDAFLENLSGSSSVLLIGGGLTMIDCVLSLVNTNFNGQIYAVSPRGYLPEGHLEKPSSYPDFFNEYKNRDLLTIFKSIRKHIAEAKKNTIPWQAVIDSVRPHAKEIWLHFSGDDKQRFITHLRHVWGVARHRLPTGVHRKMKQLISDGRLIVMDGRIREISETENGFHVGIKRRRQSNSEYLKVSRIVNCTGPQINYKELDEAFVKSLIAENIICPDEHKMGINASPGGRVLDNKGGVVKNVYAVGSMLRKVLWETTAVPELRENAENVAQQIIESID
ncbi:MAG TPA: FAD/NAD(P)-binding protein [Bacteroidia bacterium]|jgi:uncharacterized NAD(P)/FAD-binding protein YdhS